MMSYNYYKKKIKQYSLSHLLIKLSKKIFRSLKDKYKRWLDTKTNTKQKFNYSIIRKSYINIKFIDVSKIDKKLANYLSNMYCQHRFDLLGSGWVINSYDSIALGLEGYKYLMNITAPKSIASDYEPIDWQKDFKSGYRWSTKQWYKDTLKIIGSLPGVDIKVPWELARMQHLPQLAIFSIIDKNLKEQNIKEFKYQVLDFIENNPPRMGVNWACTMDVAIRASNLLLAYDIFKQLDDNNILDNNFQQIFSNCIYEHGFHIINNLEYDKYFTNNHYLSDVVGLLFISSYLENNDEVNQWLAFSIQEIISEMKKQFYEDGGNFESSTCYHRLSGELMIYSTALILGLKEEKVKALQSYTTKGWKVNPKLLSLQNQQFNINNSTLKIELPQWFIDRLYKIGRFTFDITKPNGEVPQFGDNDNGRFFRLSPNGKFLTNKEAENKYLNLKGYLNILKVNGIYESEDELYWDENILNHQTFTSCFAAIFEDDLFQPIFPLETSIIKILAKNRILEIFDKSYIPVEIKSVDINENELIYRKEKKYEFEKDISNLNFIGYYNSGIYIYKNDFFYLTVCATPIGQNGHGGHSHNDKLSYELWYNGKDIERDPGTYLYTPLPEKRNLFRSTKAHNLPVIDNIEQNVWYEGNKGLFSLIKNIEIFENKAFDRNLILSLRYQTIFIMRNFILECNSLTIIDKSNKEFYYNKYEYYSNKYGNVIRCK